MPSTILPTENPGQAQTPNDPSVVTNTSQESGSNELLDFDDFSDYSKAKIKIEKLISDFNAIKSRATSNREHRFKDLPIEDMKKSGLLPQDSFMIPMRVIDSNIRREQPSFVNYLKQSKRLVIFKSITNPTYVTTALEDEFTRGMTYSGWDIPHFKAIDGSQTHGWDSVEVMFDEKKPLHCAIEHIGNDRLIFPTDAIDIQSCAMILRHYSLTPKELKMFISNFGFDEGQVKLVLADLTDKEKGACIDMYKCMYKKDNEVYIAFYNKKASEWLRAPSPLSLGISQEGIDPLTGQPTSVDTPISFYPIFILPYYETEQQRIIDHHGRVFLDKHKQEALTANISQFLNGCQRASRPIPSAKGEVARQSEMQSIELGPDKICPIPLDWNAPAYPASTMLQLQQYLDTQNAQEAGQINFAANNRQDSRKTATEIAAASQENALLSSVQVSLYSNFIRQVYSLAWQIVQSQAVQGKITFLVDVTTGQNSEEALIQKFDIRSAGDVDVIKRQELIMQYKEFWPIIQTTPAAIPFLSRLVRLVFSDEGDSYAKIIEGGDPRAVITQLVQILSDPQVTAMLLQLASTLPPEQKMIFMQVMEQAKGIADGYVEEQIQKNPQMAEKIAVNTTGGNEGEQGGESQEPQNQESLNNKA